MQKYCPLLVHSLVNYGARTVPLNKLTKTKNKERRTKGKCKKYREVNIEIEQGREKERAPSKLVIPS
jgi:hypothetical protein